MVEELTLDAQLLQLGRRARQALEASRERAPSVAVLEFVGPSCRPSCAATPVADVLRIQAKDISRQRRTRAGRGGRGEGGRRS